MMSSMQVQVIWVYLNEYSLCLCLKLEFQDQLGYCTNANNISLSVSCSIVSPWTLICGLWSCFSIPNVSFFFFFLPRFPVFTACSCPAMAQQDGAARKSSGAAALHSRFMVGSVSEENSEDENQGKADLQLEEKENRSLSPSSCSSDSAYETGFDHVDGNAHNLRSDVKPFFSSSVSWLEYQITQMQFNLTFASSVASFDCKRVENWLYKMHRASLCLISARWPQSLKSGFRNSKRCHYTEDICFKVSVAATIHVSLDSWTAGTLS